VTEDGALADARAWRGAAAAALVLAAAALGQDSTDVAARVALPAKRGAGWRGDNGRAATLALVRAETVERYDV